MPKATQLALSHENRPGVLAHVANVLGDGKVNILACLTTTSGSEGLTHLIVDNAGEAKKVFASAGLDYTEAEVIQWKREFYRICSRPAGLALSGAMPRKQLSRSLRKRERT